MWSNTLIFQRLRHGTTKLLKSQNQKLTGVNPQFAGTQSSPCHILLGREGDAFLRREGWPSSSGMTREKSEGILGDTAGTRPRRRRWDSATSVPTYEVPAVTPVCAYMRACVCFLTFADSEESLRKRLKYKAY